MKQLTEIELTINPNSSYAKNLTCNCLWEDDLLEGSPAETGVIFLTGPKYIKKEKLKACISAKLTDITSHCIPRTAIEYPEWTDIKSNMYNRNVQFYMLEKKRLETSHFQEISQLLSVNFS